MYVTSVSLFSSSFSTHSMHVFNMDTSVIQGNWVHAFGGNLDSFNLAEERQYFYISN